MELKPSPRSLGACTVANPFKSIVLWERIIPRFFLRCVSQITTSQTPALRQTTRPPPRNNSLNRHGGGPVTNKNNNITDDTLPRSHTLRKGRHSDRDRPYLLTSVTDEREPLFREWQLGRCVVDEFRRAHESGDVHSLAWVVMPDHFHWLVTLGDSELSSVMHQVKRRSAVAINRLRGHGGRVWQPGFHDHAVRKEEDIIALARYVVANPLRAGLVDRIGDYCLWDAIWLGQDEKPRPVAGANPCGSGSFRD